MLSHNTSCDGRPDGGMPEDWQMLVGEFIMLMDGACPLVLLIKIERTIPCDIIERESGKSLVVLLKGSGQPLVL